MTSESSVSLRYEDTKENQERLTKRLNFLSTENHIFTTDERNEFFNEIADALLGIDGEKNCVIHLSDGTDLEIKKLGGFLRYLVYYKNEKLEHDIYKRCGRVKHSNDIEIKELWNELKYIIFNIYPEALSTAIHMSKERELHDFGGEGGFRIGKKGKS